MLTLKREHEQELIKLYLDSSAEIEANNMEQFQAKVVAADHDAGKITLYGKPRTLIDALHDAKAIAYCNDQPRGGPWVMLTPEACQHLQWLEATGAIPARGEGSFAVERT